MICNAGVGDPKTMVQMREMPMDDYLKTFNLNFFCPVVMTKEALPHLEKTKGNIVHVSSITGEEKKLHQDSTFLTAELNGKSGLALIHVYFGSMATKKGHVSSL